MEQSSMPDSQNPLRVGIVMAGGAGERFWPLSRQDRPKQLLRLTDPDRSMLEQAVENVRPLIAPENVFLVTSRALVEPIRRASTGIPPENILGEPCRRNTSGCLAFAAAHILTRYDASAEAVVMAVVTSDHRIKEVDLFRHTVSTILDAVENEGVLGVIGIKPDRPETGYGYIEIAAAAEPLPHCAPESPVYPVARFREKPNRQIAEGFLAAGRCFWNSGMFFWRLSSFIREAEKASPALARSIDEMTHALRRSQPERMTAVFESLDNLPIDIALLERSERVVVAPGDFTWEDVGSWEALHRTYPRDANGNVAVGDPILIDARDCVVYNENGLEKSAVAAVGVRGLAIIVTRDGVLVAPRGEAEDIKRVVAELRRRGATQL
jgi:mannose-1-phosphate guanylyltransferase